MKGTGFILGACLALAGCCTTARERVEAYARTAAENADTTRILVERCRDGDEAACDGAIMGLEQQRLAAEALGGSLGAGQ